MHVALTYSWSVYILDLAAAIGAQIDPCIDPLAVLTPLPVSWGSFENVGL